MILLMIAGGSQDFCEEVRATCIARNGLNASDQNNQFKGLDEINSLHRFLGQTPINFGVLKIQNKYGVAHYSSQKHS